MGGRHYRGSRPVSRATRRCERNHFAKPHLPPLLHADRKSLLLGTALASTLVIGSLFTPTPAGAVACIQPASPNPIIDAQATFITCVNTEPRTSAAANAIDLTTTGAGSYIDLYNSGFLTAGNNGIFTQTADPSSPIFIENVGGVAAGNNGIFALTGAANSGIEIVNSGAITAGNNGVAAFTNGAGSDISITNDATISATLTAGLFAQTGQADSDIEIVNSGSITSGYNGIFATTIADNSGIEIANSGALTATSVGLAQGIAATTNDYGSPIAIENSGDVVATSTAGTATGIHALANGANSPISLVNSGDVTVTSQFFSIGLYARTNGATNSPVSIVNSGNLNAAATDPTGYAWGIFGETRGDGSPLSIVNSGDVTASGYSFDSKSAAIAADTFGPGSPLSIVNSGNLKGLSDAYGIYADTRDYGSPLIIVNSGTITTVGPNADGIRAFTGANSPLSIVNSGDISPSGAYAIGIYAASGGANSPISVENSGTIDPVIGVYVKTFGQGSPIDIDNSGDVEARAVGIAGFSIGAGSPITITNSGTVTSTGEGLYNSVAITAIASGAGSDVIVNNSGRVRGYGAYGIGMSVFAVGLGGHNLIMNAGSVYGTFGGVIAFSITGTKIVNSGDISAGSFLAIDTNGASTQIYNSGRITGFVDLSYYGDTFINQNRGVFETKLRSFFGYGSDLFRNEQGGTVLAATDPGVSEYSSFVGLERFENKGLISLQDGQVGDTFRISNGFVTPYGTPIYSGAPPIVFNGSGQSAVAIDAFLGGPGSTADQFIIDGNISGATKVKVSNTNTGPGVFNKEGIPVVFVNGATPKGNEFFLGNPIDTGFFNYDLFFRPTGSGIFELRSFVGPGAFVLPQLITASQDIWHEGSDTWFDRTADLRVLLNGGAATIAYDPNARYAEGAPSSGNITPAVWVRGSGNWLDREDSQSVTAYGRSYKYNLDRDLETIDFQSGIDLGKRGLLSENDILIFGALGGFVHADLDYDAINRAFDYQGGQVGGYATYLRGGLFVDTLVNVHLMEIDTGRSLGFPSSLDATTVGLRTDSGYRFGSFNGGAFIEPLATIAVDWADIDGFSLGGNKVSFDDDANVRGRLGLRVGTSMQLWTGTTMEPFVIGSLWGNLSDDNQATLVSTGTTFILKDDLQDVWGEVSAGVNFFNPSANTSVFAKLDVTFGDDIDGVGGKAGMRVSW